MAQATQLYTLLKELFLLLDDGDRRLLGEFNLTVPRFYILYYLGEEPGISSRRLAELLICDKSNITRLVRAMLAEGIVEKRPHETDGRKHRLFLTAAGLALRTAVLREHTAYTRRRLNCCTQEEKSLLKASLAKLKNNLETELEPEPAAT